MFVPWQSQSSLRKHGYPITGNSAYKGKMRIEIDVTLEKLENGFSLRMFSVHTTREKFERVTITSGVSGKPE